MPNEKIVPSSFSAEILGERAIPTSFAVSIYGKVEPYHLNPMMSKTRVKTFYKYHNRNGGYFTDEMSEVLVKNAPGSPVIGHFDYETLDFTSHVRANESRAYGFIPPIDSGFAWEAHLDKDGVIRDYACFDVVLWSERYAEAKFIPGKPQSMELNPKTIKGEWKMFEDGKEAFEYTHSDLMGLCVLGEEVEPCFEGAAFYTQDGQFADYATIMKEEIVKNFSLQLEKFEGGKKTMPMKFNLPHESNFESLFNLVNPRFNEENEFIVDYMIHSINEGELYTYSCEDGKNYLVSFSTDAEGTISLGEPQELSVLFGLATEAAEVFEQLVGEGTIQDVKVKLDEFGAKIAEMESTIQEKETALAEYAEANYSEKLGIMSAEIEQLKVELTSYEAERVTALNAQKDELIDSYANLLDSEEIANYKETKADYTLEELDGKLAVIFARKYRNPESVLLPGENSMDNSNPIVSLLKSYKNRKGE